SAAWALKYPRFTCNVTTVHLPTPTAEFHWTYRAKPMNRRLGGVIYWRTAALQGNVMRTVMSRQSFEREISASEAQQVNAAIPTFDNNMSIVEETQSPGSGQSSALPFTGEPDWTADASFCSPPAK
ncbi:MAG TPA: transglutaminase, partial [Sphingomicrobium sp.]|nr:transglutaminase [Sphingomicrobium sp.]